MARASLVGEQGVSKELKRPLNQQDPFHIMLAHFLGISVY